MVFRRETVLYSIKVKVISVVCEAKATKKKYQSAWAVEGGSHSNKRAAGIRINEDLNKKGSILGWWLFSYPIYRLIIQYRFSVMNNSSVGRSRKNDSRLPLK